MQYSSNSNEALRWLVRSQPTPAGQYRQARLQMEDRLAALRANELNLKKIEANIALKELSIREKDFGIGGLVWTSAIASGMASDIDKERARQEIVLLRIEIEEMEDERADAARLVADARREMEFCQSELQRILDTTGLDFKDPEEFQAQMAQDFHERQIRHLAAGRLALQLGISREDALLVLEAPTEYRGVYICKLLEQSGEVMASLAAITDQQEQELAQLEAELNGTH